MVDLMKNLVHIHNRMERIQFRFAAGQARSIYHYEMLKIKILKCNTDIFF